MQPSSITNMAAAFRMPLQSRRDGVPCKDVEQALLALEEAALRTINVFGAHQVLLYPETPLCHIIFIYIV
jgi:hypothetical protein